MGLELQEPRDNSDTGNVVLALGVAGGALFVLAITTWWVRRRGTDEHVESGGIR
ncbi:MAG: hypothetical protein ACR2HM_09200 [Acidimicrobiales bacterium]